MNIINESDDNTYGIKAYIEKYVGQDTLFIKTSSGTRMPAEAINKYVNFTITYIGG